MEQLGLVVNLEELETLALEDHQEWLDNLAAEALQDKLVLQEPQV